jgi:branched-chain amino acid aminotransferase
MAEFTREYFICNGLLKPVAEFGQCFAPTSRYIYEVFRVECGIPVFIEDHLERLWKTAELEKIELPFSMDEILSDISKLISANPNGDGNIKIFINLPAHSPVIRLLYFNPHQYPTVEQFQKGVFVSLFKAERENPNAKVMDVSLRRAAENTKIKESAYEVLLVDRDGYITEGSRSNVFFIKNEKLITPPVHTVLEGITRKHIMKLCLEHQIPVSEELVHHEDLKRMDAVFISGTSRRVLPVFSVNELTFNVSNPLTRKLQKLLESSVAQYIASHKDNNAGHD